MHGMNIFIHSTSYEIIDPVQNTVVHYHVHMSQPLDFLKLANLIDAFFNIHLSVPHTIRPPNWSLPFRYLICTKM